jgi:hypothetical protein
VSAGDPAPGLLGIDPLAGQPHSLRVGAVERVVEGAAQTLPERGCVGVGGAAAQWRRGRVQADPGHHRNRERLDQVRGAEWETEPLPGQAQPPVPAPKLEIVAKQRAQLVDQVGRGRGVQPVAAVVDPYAVYLEAAGHAAHDSRALEYHDRVAAPGRVPGRRQSGGPAPRIRRSALVGIAGTLSGRIRHRARPPDGLMS